MSGEVWIALVGALAWIPGLWGVWEAIKKHRDAKEHQADEGDRMVVKSAIELLGPYRSRVEELETKLRDAEKTIAAMAQSLKDANEQVTDLTSQLGDAQAELRLLRFQVKTMSQQLPDH